MNPPKATKKLHWGLLSPLTKVDLEGLMLRNCVRHGALTITRAVLRAEVLPHVLEGALICDINPQLPTPLWLPTWALTWTPQ